MPDDIKGITKGAVTIALGIGLASVIGALIYNLTRAKAPQAVALSAGWNEITYIGERKGAGIAMQSITNYLEIAYYYDQFTGEWIQVVYDTILEQGMVLTIKVSDDCIWTF